MRSCDARTGQHCRFVDHDRRRVPVVLVSLRFRDWCESSDSGCGYLETNRGSSHSNPFAVQKTVEQRMKRKAQIRVASKESENTHGGLIVGTEDGTQMFRGEERLAKRNRSHRPPHTAYRHLYTNVALSRHLESHARTIHMPFFGKSLLASMRHALGPWSEASWIETSTSLREAWDDTNSEEIRSWGPSYKNLHSILDENEKR